jgi:hypothetical protein
MKGMRPLERYRRANVCAISMVLCGPFLPQQARRAPMARLSRAVGKTWTLSCLCGHTCAGRRDAKRRGGDPLLE